MVKAKHDAPNDHKTMSEVCSSKRMKTTNAGEIHIIL